MMRWDTWPDLGSRHRLPLCGLVIAFITLIGLWMLGRRKR